MFEQEIELLKENEKMLEKAIEACDKYFEEKYD